MSDGWEPLAPDFPWWLKLLAAAIATAAVATLFYIGHGIAVSAPAPFPRAFKVAPGVYDVTWDNTRWFVTLAKDGGYACKWGSIELEGSWAKNVDGNLCIVERVRRTGSYPARWTSYVVKLNSAGVGTTRDWEGKVVSVTFKRIKP